MRLVAVTRVMNEEDIIEAMARHHAALVDHHVFLDNGSSDRTLEILQALSAEGLAMTVLRNTATVFADAQLNTGLYHYAAHTLAADWVLFLDADEFIVLGDVSDLRAYLAESGCDVASIGLELVDYEAPTPNTAQESNVVKRLVRRRREGAGWWKVFVNTASAAGSVGISSGNHHVILEGIPQGPLQQESIWLAHFSNRSPYQWAAKAAAGRLKVLAAGTSESRGTSSHYTAPFERLRHDPLVWLRACLDHAEHMKTDPQLIEAPIPYLGLELRYTEAVDYGARALALTLGVAEQLAIKFGALLDAFPDMRSRIDTELATIEVLTPEVRGAAAGVGWLLPSDDEFVAMLGPGWSVSEPWGVWGIGLHHHLNLNPAARGTVECDVAAYLPPSRESQNVRVFVGTEKLADWVFTRETNRGTRLLTLPETRNALVEFRPSYATVPAEEEASSTDRRALGLALFRVRHG